MVCCGWHSIYFALKSLNSHCMNVYNLSFTGAVPNWAFPFLLCITESKRRHEEKGKTWPICLCATGHQVPEQEVKFFSYYQQLPSTSLCDIYSSLLSHIWCQNQVFCLSNFQVLKFPPVTGVLLSNLMSYLYWEAVSILCHLELEISVHGPFSCDCHIFHAIAICMTEGDKKNFSFWRFGAKMYKLECLHH